jgi:hypothetical protein
METQTGLLIAVAEFDEPHPLTERTLDLLKQAAAAMSIDFDDSWGLSRPSAGPPQSDLEQFLLGRLRKPRAGPVIVYLIGRMTLSSAHVVFTTSAVADQPKRRSVTSLGHLRDLFKRARSAVVCLALEVVVEPDSLADLETRLNYLFDDLRPDVFAMVAPNPGGISQEVEFLPLASCLAQALREDAFSPERSPESGPEAVQAIWRIRRATSSLWRWKCDNLGTAQDRYCNLLQLALT